ncbi:response regulator [Rhodoferax sp. TS-BS-61-7]|uniref:response regulator n=1 Tax=Rhodoferax sp. TS-BS-61-7 TaxID=2094194 RepID=UPI000CF67972|nr:response regulator [Rhodoferax sp. TS-BS-61-7]PQA79103.1 DNA-binding protein [Rhodoferax sp. TS-BS-61-7]
MQSNNSSPSALATDDHVTTLEAARLLGLAVRSVQLMVDRGELEAWKTPGGHRRIARASVERWRQGERATVPPAHTPSNTPRANPAPGERAARVLLIEDSVHFQNLIKLLLGQQFPQVELLTASDGIAGLAMVGQYQPDVLMVDILLPGIDGAALITSLRAMPQFQSMQIIVVTSLDTQQLAPYAFALQGIAVVHKPQLVGQLPSLLSACLQQLSGPRG